MEHVPQALQSRSPLTPACARSGGCDHRRQASSQTQTRFRQPARETATLQHRSLGSSRSSPTRSSCRRSCLAKSRDDPSVCQRRGRWLQTCASCRPALRRAHLLLRPTRTPRGILSRGQGRLSRPRSGTRPSHRVAGSPAPAHSRGIPRKGHCSLTQQK